MLGTGATVSQSSGVFMAKGRDSKVVFDWVPVERYFRLIGPLYCFQLPQ